MFQYITRFYPANIFRYGLLTTTMVLLLSAWLLQLPALLLIDSDNLMPGIINILLHSVFLGASAHPKSSLTHAQKRTLFFSVFTSYFVNAWLFWPLSLQLHYFMLFGLIGCGIFFRRDEHLQRWSWAIIFAALFLTGHAAGLSERESEIALLQWLNGVTLCGSALLILLLFERHLSSRWSVLEAHRAKNAATLAQLIPHYPGTNHPWQSGQVYCLPRCGVLFTDLSGFTSYALSLDDSDLVAILNELYATFDSLCSAAKTERIKTIGDGYMVISTTTDSLAEITSEQCHAMRLYTLSQSLCAAFSELKKHHQLPCDLRIGIAIGSVTVGIIGSAKPQFDAWGKTVNQAAKLEQSARCGEVNICPRMAELLP